MMDGWPYTRQTPEKPDFPTTTRITDITPRFSAIRLKFISRECVQNLDGPMLSQWVHKKGAVVGCGPITKTTTFSEARRRKSRRGLVGWWLWQINILMKLGRVFIGRIQREIIKSCWQMFVHGSLRIAPCLWNSRLGPNLRYHRHNRPIANSRPNSTTLPIATKTRNWSIPCRKPHCALKW